MHEIFNSKFKPVWICASAETNLSQRDKDLFEQSFTQSFIGMKHIVTQIFLVTSSSNLSS